MNKYIIQYGIAGGFNDSDRYMVILAEDIDQANYKAFCESCAVYEEYIGCGGLRDIFQIMEDEDCSEEDALDIFSDEREGWIDYMVHEYSTELLKKITEDYGIDYETEDLRN